MSLSFQFVLPLVTLSLAFASAQEPPSVVVRTTETSVITSSTVVRDKGATRNIEIRAVLQDPMNPGAAFQVQIAPTVFDKLQLVAEGLSVAMKISVTDNTVALYGPKAGDPKTGPPLVANAVVAPGVERCLLVIVPEPAGSKLPYHLVVLDDTGKAFPFGESRVVNLTDVALGMQAGATRLSLPAHSVSPLPLIKDVNEYHMGQTNFYAKSGNGDQWMPFAERQVQYLETVRRISLIDVTPGAVAPTVRTVIDHVPFTPPAPAGGPTAKAR